MNILGSCVRTGLTLVKRFSFALIALMLLPSLSSHAGGEKCYTLVPRARGQFAMCLELEKNLNEFCGEQPMVCELKISPKYPKLKLPKWTTLDITQNMSLIERMTRGSMLRGERNSLGSTEYNWAMLRDRIGNNENHGKASLSRAQIDLTNGGRRETIYRVDTGFCPELNFGKAANDSPWREIIAKRQPSQRYIKTDPLVYSERHAKILENPEWRARAESGQEPFPGASETTFVTDIFYYEGRAFKFDWELMPWVQEITTFRDKWPETPDSVFQTTVCQFTYSGSEH